MNETTFDPAAGLIAGSPFAGRHAVVTGASRGIGAAIASTLARLGADVTLVGRNTELLEVRRREIEGTEGRRAMVAAVDITDAIGVEAAFACAADALGPPSILVNNAGIAVSAPFHRASPDHWHEIVETNLTGTYICTRQLYPAMREAGWGRIVNVASTAGLKGYGYVVAYCAAKHGIIGLTRGLAVEAAKTGVTVNAVCPGYTETDIVAETIANIVTKTGRSEEEALAELTAGNPQGRLVQPGEVAEAVAWLCLPSSASVTGQSIVIAGGEVM